MYYIEFVKRNPGVPQQRFQEIVRMSNERWQREHPEDELVVMIGRTWRMGPKPGYMVIWRIKDFSTFHRWTTPSRARSTRTSSRPRRGASPPRLAHRWG